MNWNRIHAYQLELAEKEATIRRLTDDLFRARCAETEQRQNVTALSEEIEDLRRQRDTARRIAMRLEEENHHLAGAVCALCSQEIVVVPVIGDAS